MSSSLTDSELLISSDTGTGTITSITKDGIQVGSSATELADYSKSDFYLRNGDSSVGASVNNHGGDINVSYDDIASSNINEHGITLDVTGDELSSSVRYAMNFNLPKPGVGGGDLTGVSMISFSQTDTAGTDSFEVFTSGQKQAGNPGNGLTMKLKSAGGMVTSFQPFNITIGPSSGDSFHTNIRGGEIELKSASLPRLAFTKTNAGTWSINYDSNNILSFIFNSD